MRWHRPVGAVFVVVGVAMFVLMVYGIVNWSAMWALSIFVFLGCVATGLTLMMAPRTVKPDIVPEIPVQNPPREERGGTGFGYCPECGSPLNDGDRHCGVCGRRLRCPGS